MQEVGGFLGGDWDYGNLEGDTGPLVYPAGFVYLYSVFYWVTGKGADIRLAQWIFVGLYVLFIWVVLEIYNKTRVIPPWAVILVCASRRIHSIFVLRLFNDCFAVLFLYIAVWLFIKNRWSWGCFWFSLAVSIKMNILLFAPSLLILMWKRFGFWGTIPKLAICASLQVLLALPFLYEDAWDYFGRAFEFRRQFKYIWTVNLKFLPEELFLNKTLALCLLLCHVSLLLLFLHLWEKKGLAGVFKQRCVRMHVMDG